MKRLVLLFAFIFNASFAFGAEQSLLARVTVYWRAESPPVAASNGASLQAGHCAVDPKKIPYGSKVVIDDEELTAVDTGTAVVNRRAARLCGRTPEQRQAPVVDRYFETKAQAVAWEKRHSHFMTVRIVTQEPSPAHSFANAASAAAHTALRQSSAVGVCD